VQIPFAAPIGANAHRTGNRSGVIWLDGWIRIHHPTLFVGSDRMRANFPYFSFVARASIWDVRSENEPKMAGCLQCHG
jgi:hypothetical protein